jgi:hypothetical protein
MKRLVLFVLFLLIPLTIVAILLGTSYVLSLPTTGLQLAQQARQAQIDAEQAQVAKDLSAASLAEAQARAVERQSITDTLGTVASSTVTTLGCLLLLGVAGLAVWAVAKTAREVAKVQR